MTKEKVLEKIATNLEKIENIYAECEKLANDNNVEFGLDEPLTGAAMSYFPRGFKPKEGSNEAYVEKNFGSSIAATWLSSSDYCS
jgi:hypothetical protein